MFIVLPALLVSLVASGCGTPMSRFEFTRLVMGVEARVVVYSPDMDTAVAHAQAAYDRLEALDACLSDYRVDSELARFLKGLPGEPQPVTADFATMLHRAAAIRDLSAGAFDIEVGACVRLWREARKSGALPPPEAIARARSIPGDPGFRVDRSAGTATLTRPGASFDFGGIGKGFAAQEAVDVLRARGARRCLVAMAGDIVAGDAPPGHPGWDIAISRSSKEPPFASMRIANLAISTSGDAEQHVVIAGERYSHLVDPRTGEALRTAACASVLALRGEDADAWASALCVLAARGEPAPALAGDPLADAAWIIDIGGEWPSRTVQNDALWRRVRLKWADAEAVRRP